MTKARQKVLFSVRPRSTAPSSSDAPRSRKEGSYEVQESVGAGRRSTSKIGPDNQPLITPPNRGVSNKGVSVGSGVLSENKKPEKRSLDEILAGVGELSKSDRKELLARLALAEQAPAQQSRDLDMWGEAVYSALVAAIGAGDGTGLGPLPLKRLLGASNSWEPVLGLMKSSGMLEFQVVKRQAIYNMLAELLIDDAQKLARAVGAPMSAKFVANRAAQLSAIVDAAYPGYLRAGLMPMVADRLAQRRNQSTEGDEG